MNQTVCFGSNPRIVSCMTAEQTSADHKTHLLHRVVETFT